MSAGSCRYEVGVVRDTDVVSAREKGAREQRIFRIGEIDMLITGIELHGPYDVFGSNLEHGVVGDNTSHTPEGAGNVSGRYCATCVEFRGAAETAS